MKILSAAALLTGLLLSARAPTEGPVTYALAPDQLADDGVHALTLDISAPDPELHGQGPFPAIVWIHGGGWRYGNLYDGFGKGVLVHGPERGYVGVSINYRLTLDEDEDGDPRFPWPAQIQDSRCALRWLSNSGGGHLALLLSQGSDQSQWDTDFCEHDGAVEIAAAFSRSGPTDSVRLWETTIDLGREWAALALGVSEESEAAEISDVLDEVSPLMYVDEQDREEPTLSYSPWPGCEN